MDFVKKESNTLRGSQCTTQPELEKLTLLAIQAARIAADDGSGGTMLVCHVATSVCGSVRKGVGRVWMAHSCVHNLIKHMFREVTGLIDFLWPQKTRERPRGRVAD